jgi:hypothetical protein
MTAWKLALTGGIVALGFPLFTNTARADVPLGIGFADPPAGVVVTDGMPGRIADRCMPRLRPGARIVSANGAPVKSAEQVAQVVVSSDFIRFQFVDATGELRWAQGWSGPRPVFDCRP